MQHDGDKRRKMDQKKILLPEGGPREIEEQSSHFEANNDQQSAQDAVHGYEKVPWIREFTKSTDRFLEGSDAVSDVAIIDIHRVDLGETLQRCFRLTRGFLGNPQIIPQREDAFRLDARSTEGALIPDGGDARLAFLHKGEAEKSAALHYVAEGLAAVRGLGDFLKFADGFIYQTHLAESDSKIVVSLEVFIFRAHFAKFGAEVVKDLLERAVLGRSGRFFLELRRSGW